MLLVAMSVNVTAATMGFSFDVPPGMEVFERSIFPDGFTDSYAYFGQITVGKGNIYSINTTKGYGWVVYRFKAVPGYIITHVVPTIKTYGAAQYVAGDGDVDAFWTSHHYNGTAVPNVLTWNDLHIVQQNNGTWVDHTPAAFSPNSNEFFLAYRLLNTTADNWRTQLAYDKMKITTVAAAEPENKKGKQDETAVIKQLKKENKQLREENKELRNRIKVLEDKIARLKKILFSSN